METSLPIVQEISGSIPSSALEFFCGGELFQGMFRLGPTQQWGGMDDMKKEKQESHGSE